MTEYPPKNQSQAPAGGIESINFQIALAWSAKKGKKNTILNSCISVSNATPQKCLLQCKKEKWNNIFAL